MLDLYRLTQKEGSLHLRRLQSSVRSATIFTLNVLMSVFTFAYEEVWKAIPKMDKCNFTFYIIRHFTVSVFYFLTNI